MKQEQQLGSKGQQQLANNKLPDQRPDAGNVTVQKEESTEKPAVTNDQGNAVDKKTEDAGKGYSEKKQTEAWSDVPQTKQEPQAAEFEDDRDVPLINKDHKVIPQQEGDPDVEKHLKRAKQAEDVQG